MTNNCNKNTQAGKIIDEIKKTDEFGIELVYFDYGNLKGSIRCDKSKELEVFAWLRKIGANPYNTKLSFSWYKTIEFTVN